MSVSISALSVLVNNDTVLTWLVSVDKVLVFTSANVLETATLSLDCLSAVLVLNTEQEAWTKEMNRIRILSLRSVFIGRRVFIYYIRVTEKVTQEVTDKTDGNQCNAYGRTHPGSGSNSSCRNSSSTE